MSEAGGLGRRIPRGGSEGLSCPLLSSPPLPVSCAPTFVRQATPSLSKGGLELFCFEKEAVRFGFEFLLQVLKEEEERPWTGTVLGEELSVELGGRKGRENGGSGFSLVKKLNE